MSSKNIIFFNHYHNGDIVATREFIKEIVNFYPEINFSYAHHNGEKILRDINVAYIDIKELSNIPENQKFVYQNDTLFVNTWIGNYQRRGIFWAMYYEIFASTYQVISEFLNKEIRVSKASDYLPKINYDFFDIPKDFEYFFDKTILFSNGPVNSGQSYLSSTEGIVAALVNNFPDYRIILTHQSSLDASNILYTNNLISTIGSDLNEISWLAQEHCKYIIGRNSGPYLFALTDKVMNDHNRFLFSFGCNPTDCFNYEMDFNAKIGWLLDGTGYHNGDESKVIDSILSFINKDLEKND